MGEAKLKRTATQRLISEHPHCYFCGGERAATTREHMPPIALFDSSHRPQGFEMPACQACNRDTSTADLAASIISRWRYDGNEDKTLTDQKHLIRQMLSQQPSLIKDWRKVGAVARKRYLQHLQNHDIIVPDDAGMVSLGSETTKYLNLFAHKAVIALYFQHYRKPLPKTGGLIAHWRRYEDLVGDSTLQTLLNMLPQWARISQGRWDERKTFQYRYALNEEDGLFGCLVNLRGALFIYGFAATDTKTVFKEDIDETWMSPDDPITLLESSRFLKR